MKLIKLFSFISSQQLYFAAFINHFCRQKLLLLLLFVTIPHREDEFPSFCLHAPPSLKIHMPKVFIQR